MEMTAVSSSGGVPTSSVGAYGTVAPIEDEQEQSNEQAIYSAHDGDGKNGDGRGIHDEGDDQDNDDANSCDIVCESSQQENITRSDTARGFYSVIHEMILGDLLNDTGHDAPEPLSSNVTRVVWPDPDIPGAARLAYRALEHGAQYLPQNRRALFFPEPGPLYRQLIFWDLMLGFLIAYQLLLTPIWIAFGVSPGDLLRTPVISWINIVIDILYIVDIVITFYRAYLYKETRSGTFLQWDLKEIRANYIRNGLVIDLIAAAALPLNLTFTISPSNRTKQPALLARILRLLRIFRLVRIRQYFHRYDDRPFTALILTISKLIFIIFFVAHWIACFWFLIGKQREKVDCMEEDDACKDGDEILGWVDQQPFETDAEDSDQRFRLYISSLYWSFTTMSTVGYGDITGSTTYERIFCIFIFLAGGFTFAYVIGLASGYISEMNVSKIEYREKLDRIRQYTEAKGVKSDLQKRIIGFFKTKYSRSALFDESAILKEMPRSLRRELVLELYKDVIDTVPFLSESRDNESLLATIAQALSSYYAAAGEILLKEGQENYRNLYIVRHGLIELSHSGNVVKEISDTAFFGTMGLIGLLDVSPFTALAVTWTEILILEHDKYKRIAREFPNVKVQLRKSAKFYARCYLKMYLRNRPDRKKVLMDGLYCKSPDLIAQLKKNGLDIFSSNSRAKQEPSISLYSKSFLQRNKSFRMSDFTSSNASIEDTPNDSGLDEAVAEQNGIDPVALVEFLVSPDDENLAQPDRWENGYNGWLSPRRCGTLTFNEEGHDNAGRAGSSMSSDLAVALDTIYDSNNIMKTMQLQMDEMSAELRALRAALNGKAVHSGNRAEYQEDNPLHEGKQVKLESTRKNSS